MGFCKVVNASESRDDRVLALIRVIHKKVPGRARFKVQGLYGSGRIKCLLEHRLSVNASVLEVKANSSTGNLLICYARETSFQVIQGLLLSTLSDALDEDRPKSLPESTRKAFPNRNPSSLSKRISGPVIRLKDKMQELLSPEAQPDAPWHILPREQVMLALGSTSRNGLSLETVTERQGRYGPNILPEPNSRSPWDILKDQFLSLPVALLSIAAGVSIITGGILDALVIAGVVAANGLIGYATESEAERTITSLKRIARPIAAITREGRMLDIPAEELVVGDIVTLKPDAYVPADGCSRQDLLSPEFPFQVGASPPAWKLRTRRTGPACGSRAVFGRRTGRRSGSRRDSLPRERHSRAGIALQAAEKRQGGVAGLRDRAEEL